MNLTQKLLITLLAPVAYLLPQAASAASGASGADWVLTTSDFESRPVSLEKIGPDGVAVAADGGTVETVETVGFDRLLQLQRAKPDAHQPVAGDFVVEFADGSRLVGRPAASDAAGLQIDTKSLGRVGADVARVRSIHRPGVALLPPDATQDVVRLTNGDRTAGIFKSLDAKNVTLEDATLPLDAVAAVDFAVLGPPKPAANGARAFRVGLSDGSSVNGTIESADGQTLHFRPTGGKLAEVPLADVTSIEQVNGPVTWLSSLTPEVAERTPYLETAASAASPGPAFAADRSITGDPIVAGGKPYSRGLGVHSRSTLTFAVPQGAKKFRTQYALVDGLPYADVTVRVLLDGKPVHAAKNVRSGALAPAVEVPLSGAKRLTLEVGYGENYDVQDRFNWIQPAFVK